ncbi:FAD-dependent oxidoreductase [Microbacterium suaedae]|uniref:FAD-dependent oxidoreductase n=1 Tax=Microbacterium suaedae TaxID=2067813 RepID=UPI000DA1CFBF|nr:FAD-dependent oxidoreductase [Microbacterium suaedae]
MTDDAVDYVVVGAGLAGASTAWRLTQRGHSVAVVERDVPAGDRGSSHGSARIFRYAYADPFYTRLVQRSEAGWAELASAHGSPLIRQTGCLDFGAKRDPEMIDGLLADEGVEADLLSAETARDRFPGILADTAAVWHPAAGVLDAQTTVEAMLRASGSVVRTDWPVSRVERAGAGYAIIGPGAERLVARGVVIAAGGWLPDLLGRLDLPASFARRIPPLTVMQETAFHFPYRDPAAAEAWPSFIHMRDEITVYGLPGGRDADDRGQKIAEFNGGVPLDDASRQRQGHVDPAHRDRIVRYVERFVPGLVPEPYAETSCLFTNTPDEDFVIDRADGITIVSACSGHGAKFAPLLGELAADVATGGEGVERFRVSASPSADTPSRKQ